LSAPQRRLATFSFEHDGPPSPRFEAIELNGARHAIATTALAEQRKAGDLAFGYYARAWLDSQRLKASSGKVKADTVDGYEKRLAVYALPKFGAGVIASITPAHCEQFLAALVGG
jgi:integrase